jgi:peroxiredoxin
MLLSACASAPAAPNQALPRTVPEVEVATLDGHPTRVDALTSGKVAVLALWAPWCEACGAELSALKRLQQSASPHGAVVVGIAVGESRAKVAEFVAGRELEYPQLVDEQFHLADALGQRRVPATLVVDRAGHVTYAGGALDADALDALRAALQVRLRAIE